MLMVVMVMEISYTCVTKTSSISFLTVAFELWANNLLTPAMWAHTSMTWIGREVWRETEQENCIQRETGIKEWGVNSTQPSPSQYSPAQPMQFILSLKCEGSNSLNLTLHLLQVNLC